MPKKESPANSKLFKLKEWLTVTEAARHLSILFGEEVKEADVLRLSLDGHLKLSVDFVNHAKAIRGDKFISPEEWEKEFRKVASWETANFLATMQGMIAIYFGEFDIVFFVKDDELINSGVWAFGPDEQLKTRYLSKRSIEEQNEILNIMIEDAILHNEKQSRKYNGQVPPNIHSFKGNVITIKGVWDLPMLGTERIAVEDKCQLLTGGPEVTLCGLDGAFIKDEDDVIWQLQDEFDKEFFEKMDSEETKKKKIEVYAEYLKKRISNNEIDEMEAKELMDQHTKDLEKPRDYNERFFPAGSLPDDCVLVVRTKALREFEKSISDKTQMKIPEENNRDNPKKIASLLKMIITMAVKGYGYSPKAKKSEIPSEMVKDAEQLGLAIDPDTVRKWLKEAAELLDQNLPDNS